MENQPVSVCEQDSASEQSGLEIFVFARENYFWIS